MRAVILAATLCAASSLAHAAEPSWYPIAAACTRWAEANICRGKAGCPSWEWDAQCTIEQALGTPGHLSPDAQSRFDWCVNQIERRRARHFVPYSQTGAFVADAIDCVTR
jgi:hypothetical protein